jgi:hypothetical protein
VPLPLELVFHPTKVWPVLVKLFAVRAVGLDSVSPAIVPVPPLALKVTA